MTSIFTQNDKYFHSKWPLFSLKMTTFFTQNDNFDNFEWNSCHFAFAQVVRTAIFSQLEMSQQPKTNADLEDPDEYYARGHAKVYREYIQTERIWTAGAA